MARRLPILLLVSVLFPGCIRREGMNFACDWPSESTLSLDLQNPTHQRHLRDDVEVAEELAIRYTDRLVGRRPVVVGGIVVRTGAGSRAMEDRARFHLECETNLFGAIADIHDVTVEDGLTARGRLGDKGLDPWVNLPMAALYVFVAIGATRRIRSRFPPDERWPAIVTTCFVSFVVSAILLMLGSLWSGAFEVVRVGNEHLSYRAFRSSWRQHWLEWFVVGVLLVWIIALVRYRLTRQEGSLDEHEAAP